jgi:hypothetical protein
VHDEIRAEGRAASSGEEEIVRRMELARDPGRDVAVYRAGSRRCESSSA